MSRTDGLAVLVWVALLALVLALPELTHSSTLGDDLTRNTVRLSLAFYALAAVRMLTIGFDDTARWLWSLAWLAYIVHLGMAFHYYHGWSHAAAIRHVHERSGFGEGIYVSHLFTLFWTLDVLFWWVRPDGYLLRSPWIGRVLHGFMAFMVFNATVVYEQGLIRWAGIALFALLGPLWLWRVWTKLLRPIPRPGI